MTRKKDNLYIKAIEKAIHSNEIDDFEEAVDELDIFLMGCSFFPEEIFESLIDIIASNSFLNMENGFSLLLILRDYLEQLDDVQKVKLIDNLENLYPNLKWVAMGIIFTEIIVNIYKDERSLKILKGLMTTEAEDPRGWLAYGLFYFIGECEDQGLKEDALSHLKILLEDESEFVRYEAKLHFDKLSAKNN